MIAEREEKLSSEESASRVSVLYTVFLLISFLGWVLEEVFFLARGRGFADRGFLSFPICIVYGLGMMTTYFSFGLPQRMRLFSFVLPAPKSSQQKLAHALFYILLAGVACTLCELLVGLWLDVAFGILMWDYRETPWNVGPYICAPFGLIWGVLAYLFMRLAFLPLLSFVARLHQKTLFSLLLPLTVFLLFDLSMNCTYSFYHRAHMALW